MTGVSLENDDNSRAIRSHKIARKLKKVICVDTVAEEVLRVFKKIQLLGDNMQMKILMT